MVRGKVMMRLTRHMYSLWGVALALCLFALVPDAFALHPFSPTYKRISQVQDHAKLLNTKVRNEILSTADDAEYFTGRQMIILTVPTFKGWPPQRVAEYYGKKLRLGVEKSGVLLVVAKKEKQAYIGIGPGLERLINGKVIHNILTYEIIPELNKDDFQQAVRKGVDALADALDGDYKTPAEKRKQYLPFVIPIPVLILMKLIFGKGQGRNFFGGGSWKRW